MALNLFADDYESPFFRANGFYGQPDFPPGRQVNHRGHRGNPVIFFWGGGKPMLLTFQVIGCQNVENCRLEEAKACSRGLQPPETGNKRDAPRTGCRPHRSGLRSPSRHATTPPPPLRGGISGVLNPWAKAHGYTPRPLWGNSSYIELR